VICGVVRELLAGERETCTEGSKVDKERSGLLIGGVKLHVKRRILS
jgi:hypothetical protein